MIAHHAESVRRQVDGYTVFHDDPGGDPALRRLTLPWIERIKERARRIRQVAHIDGKECE